MSEDLLIKKTKKSLDEWLDEVDYTVLNSPSYMPSEFALTFMNWIKLVNGSEGESHITPPVHLAMLDKITMGTKKYIANLCFRGAAKTTLFFEYLVLFLAQFGYLPGLGKVEGMIYVSDSMENGVASARKNVEFRYNNSPYLQRWIPHAKFTDKYLEFRNISGHLLGCKMFGAKTGLRGTKIFGKRPVLAVLDDLVSDDDARSPTAMESINDTVYKGVNHALDPTRRKTILNGTPFNTEDILIQAVESGAWDVNVWPVCERFPCTREEFVGAWPDRFSYDMVAEQYQLHKDTGKLAAFYQELMLRITTGEEQLVQSGELRWYSRAALLKRKSDFNFYITTDFATSAKQKSDFSVISVWAYNSNGDWFWVDGMVEKQTMEKNIDALFKFVLAYSPQSVGIEVNGQQKGFIAWIQREMMARNVYFNLASSEKSGDPGIRSVADKLSRFNMVVPWFKVGKFHFPEELRESKALSIGLAQIALVTKSGIKGKDDFVDTVSMLGMMTVWKPQGAIPTSEVEVDLWEDVHGEPEPSALASYIV